MIRSEIRNKVDRAVSRTLRAPVDLREEHSFVADLGYDSLRVASLAMALDSEFGRPILLNDWLAEADDPLLLTVGSLRAYLETLLGEES